MKQLRLFIAEKLLIWAANIAPKNDIEGNNLVILVYQYFSGVINIHKSPLSPNNITKEAFYKIKNSSCGQCKFRKQGPTCCFCNHPEQDNKSLKGYVYHNFNCHLFTGYDAKPSI